MAPLLSFVMPTRDRGERIGRTLETLVGQTIQDIEVIIVDDHSLPGDTTRNAISEFNDERLRYIRIPDAWPAGIATARNFGNMYARAPYIAVADSDDFNVPERAEETLRAFDSTGADIVYGLYDILDENTNEVRERKSPILEFDVASFAEYDYVPHGTSAYRRQLALDFPYNPFFLRAEDYDFFSRLATAGKTFHRINKKLIQYVLHGKNTSGGKADEGYDELIHLNRGWKQSGRTKILDKIIAGNS